MRRYWEGLELLIVLTTLSARARLLHRGVNAANMVFLRITHRDYVLVTRGAAPHDQKDAHPMRCLLISYHSKLHHRYTHNRSHKLTYTHGQTLGVLWEQGVTLCGHQSVSENTQHGPEMLEPQTKVDSLHSSLRPDTTDGTPCTHNHTYA